MEYRMDARPRRKLELICYLDNAFLNWKGPIKPVSKFLRCSFEHYLLATRMQFKENKVSFIEFDVPPF